ncbi:MAG: hypothetical protein ABWW69_03165 [Pyrodictiaceae archaeon]
MVCEEEVREATSNYGLGEEEATKIICSYGLALLHALKPLLDKLDYEPKMAKSIEIDPEGPRIVIKLSGNRIREAYIDFSPDGAEHTITIALDYKPRRARPEDIEESLSRIIESDEEFTGVEEYDVSYNPEDNTLTIVLISRLITSQPGLSSILRAVEKALMSI